MDWWFVRMTVVQHSSSTIQHTCTLRNIIRKYLLWTNRLTLIQTRYQALAQPTLDYHYSLHTSKSVLYHFPNNKESCQSGFSLGQVSATFRLLSGGDTSCGMTRNASNKVCQACVKVVELYLGLQRRILERSPHSPELRFRQLDTCTPFVGPCGRGLLQIHLGKASLSPERPGTLAGGKEVANVKCVQ